MRLQFFKLPEILLWLCPLMAACYLVMGGNLALDIHLHDTYVVFVHHNFWPGIFLLAGVDLPCYFLGDSFVGPALEYASGLVKMGACLHKFDMPVNEDLLFLSRAFYGTWKRVRVVRELLSKIVLLLYLHFLFDAVALLGELCRFRNKETQIWPCMSCSPN